MAEAGSWMSQLMELDPTTGETTPVGEIIRNLAPGCELSTDQENGIIYSATNNGGGGFLQGVKVDDGSVVCEKKVPEIEFNAARSATVAIVPGKNILYLSDTCREWVTDPRYRRVFRFDLTTYNYTEVIKFDQKMDGLWLAESGYNVKNDQLFIRAIGESSNSDNIHVYDMTTYKLVKTIENAEKILNMHFDPEMKMMWGCGEDVDKNITSMYTIGDDLTPKKQFELPSKYEGLFYGIGTLDTKNRIYYVDLVDGDKVRYVVGVDLAAGKVVSECTADHSWKGYSIYQD